MKTKLSIIAAGLVFAACASTGGAPATGTIEVTGQDYSYSGIPDVVASGAELTFTNASDVEVHEMMVVKVLDIETRTIEELLALPESESESLVEFQGVLVALPGEDGSNPEGEGSSITVTEAGRYAVVCFIPQGADPAIVAEAMESGAAAGGPPDLGEGTPHALLGMVAEFQVEEA
jgi:plastocyanin